MELLPLDGFPLVQPGDDLAELIGRSLADNGLELRTGDLLALAQKIVSKAEGRYVRLEDVQPGVEAQALAAKVDKDARLVELILQQSASVVRHRPGVLIVEHKLGLVHANAGIDQSNIEQGAEQSLALLLPEDPDASAATVRTALESRFGVKLAVLINDSAGRAWRNGTCGMAIGCSGFEPVLDLIGERDMFGQELRVTTVAVADELAAAASFLMGQADEACPVVLIRGAELRRDERCGSASLIRDPEMDLFR